MAGMQSPQGYIDPSFFERSEVGALAPEGQSTTPKTQNNNQSFFTSATDAFDVFSAGSSSTNHTESRGSLYERDSEFASLERPLGVNVAVRKDAGSSTVQRSSVGAEDFAAQPVLSNFPVSVSGDIMARTSLRTLVFKAWKEKSFWVRLHPLRLLLFRSCADYKDWESNPYHSDAARKTLVKLEINFVTDITSSIHLKGYKLTETKSKAYNSKPLNTFKLERIMDHKQQNIAAAFASVDISEIDVLRTHIAAMIEQGKKMIADPNYVVPGIDIKDFGSNDVRQRLGTAGNGGDLKAASEGGDGKATYGAPSVAKTNSAANRSQNKSAATKDGWDNNGNRLSVGDSRLSMGRGSVKSAYDFDDMIGDN